METLPIYRSAVALNNMGVALLEKHCYKQALDTLRDAAFAIHSVSQSTEMEELRNSDLNISRRNELAMQRMAKPEPNKEQVICVTSVTLNQTAGAIISLLEESLSSYTSLFPIRIDNIDGSALKESGIGPCVEAAVIFHNVGLAFLTQAMVAKCSRPTLKHHNSVRRQRQTWKKNLSAVRFLRLSYSMQVKILGKTRQNSNSIFSEILHVMAIILSSLMKALTSVGDNASTIRYGIILHNVTEHIEEIETFIVQNRLVPHLAAAA